VYFAEKLRVPKATQIVGTLEGEFTKNELRVTNPLIYF
jgi:hypothetical protein